MMDRPQELVLGFDSAYSEAQRWIEAVTKKKFASCNFRSSLGNGVLLCDLINKIKPGTIKKLNRLSTPIAGLDNLNLFLKACAKLGLKEAQLFHPGDLQDLSTRVTVKHQESSRRLKNVLITIFWLGRKAHGDCFYNGPYLKFKAFEALLGTALYKALEDCTSSCEDSVRKRSCSDSCFPEKDELFQLRAGHKREDSLDSLNSLSSRTHSSSSDPTLKGSSEGCSSDPEAELSFTMSDNPEYRRSLIVSPKSTTSFNQFLPTRDKQSGYVPAPLRKKRSERNDDSRRSWASPMFTEDDGNFSSHEKAGSNISSNSELKSQTSVPTAHQSMAYEYESSDSDADRPDPDVVQDDFASRRFHSPSPVVPTNFALPMIPLETAAIPRAAWPQVAITNAPRQTMAPLSSQSEPLQRAFRRPASTDICIYDDSGDDEDDEFGYADPVQDDLYARKVTLMHQPPATVPYDKFLPKFWTPEEDAHVRKIKLGSQRRPWYRKIQGFSRRKSGSSSEDSDGDMGPWLSVPPFSRTHSEPPSSHSHVPESRLTSSPSSQTDTATVAQQIAALPKLEPLEFWPSPDPTSGPKLIKCEKHSLRGREHPNDPFNVSADIMPDLENDDMFARRTHAFHSSDALAEMKYGDFLLRHHSSGSAVSLVTQRRPEDEPSFPDVEKDDVVYRRIQQMNQKRPLSGAPDIYHPVPIPEPSALPPKLKAKLMCVPFEPRLRQYKPETKEEAEQHLKADDMLLRKLKALDTKGTMNLRLNSAATQQTPSGSNSCSEEDMCKWQAIREASRLRYKKKLMVERLLQKSSDSDGSKSVSDMTADETNTPNMELRFEELQKMRELLKESEEKWQDDLTRWKNKRRSVNSDIVKKKEEREQIDQISSSVPRKSKTFKEMQDERQSREQSNYSYSLSSSTDDVFEEPSRRRTLPPRSYTVDNPYAALDKPLSASIPALREQEPNSGSLAPVQKDFPSKRDSSSPSNIKNNTKESQKTTRNLLDDPVPDSSPGLIQPTSIMKPTSNGNDSQPSESTGNAKTVENSTGPIGSLYKPNSVNTKQPGLDHVSASLPRSNQRSDSARLTSVVTPRPFGAQASRISSLPRAFTMDESHKRTNGETDSLSKRYATEYEDISHVSNEDEEEERSERVTPSPPHVSRVSPLPKVPSPTDSAKERSYSDMRISLNQKPNSSRDFGFQTDWDSTGVRVKSVMPGSPAEIGQVKVGDEVLTVNRQQVADMSYNQWKDSMEEALQQGSLLMDIRRHGWNSSPEPYINTNLDLTSHKTMDTAVKTINVSSQPFNNDGSNRINGCIHEDVHAMNSKESESISLKNLKRRSEFFEQGGSETAISNLPVPSLSTSSTRWSWDPEEERRRQEKWQKEQERLLQEKYKKDQEKLDEEWNKVQQELVKESARSYEEELKSFEQDKHGTLSSVRPSVFSWEEQESSRLAQQEAERKKREEERQRLEEEWRKREEQERLEEERKREDEERKKRQERLQLEEEERRKRVEQARLEEERKKKEETERVYHEKEKKRMEEERRRLQEQDQTESFGYTNAFQELSYSHRSFSKSTPELDEVAKPDIKASGGLGVSMDKKKESVAEVERQQILQEMRKKTSLNTDNSWIRQQSTSTITAREPINLPIRRGESLDNLDMPRGSWRSSWSTTNSVSTLPDFSRPHSSLSGSSSHLPSSILQTSQSMSSLKPSPSPLQSSTHVPPRNRSVSGRKVCSFCNTPLGKGAAMIIESLGLCFHLSCFKCSECRSDLGGSEAGAEVRIRNQQLFCNTCYVRLKTGQPTAM